MASKAHAYVRVCVCVRGIVHAIPSRRPLRRRKKKHSYTFHFIVIARDFYCVRVCVSAICAPFDDVCVRAVFRSSARTCATAFFRCVRHKHAWICTRLNKNTHTTKKKIVHTRARRPFGTPLSRHAIMTFIPYPTRRNVRAASE